MKKVLITLLLLTAFSAQAFTPVSEDIFKSPFRKFFEKVWECTWHISCYQKPLGAFTTLSDTDSQVDFPTTYNANLVRTVEVGTSSVASITTLPNLVSIGTITTGVWNGTAITVPYGGTGSTTLSSNQILLGRGTSQVGVVNGYGSSGQFLISQGQGNAPIWSTSVIDEAGSYAWTGTHSFAATVTHTATTSFQKVRIASTDTSETGLVVSTSTHFSKGVSIGGTATTTNNTNLEITGNLIVSGRSSTTAYLLGYASSTVGVSALDTTAGNNTSVTATCPAGTEILSGGFDKIPDSAGAGISYVVLRSGVTDTSLNSWTVEVECQGGTCTAGTLKVHAICADVRQ